MNKFTKSAALLLGCASLSALAQRSTPPGPSWVDVGNMFFPIQGVPRSADVGAGTYGGPRLGIAGNIRGSHIWISPSEYKCFKKVVAFTNTIMSQTQAPGKDVYFPNFGGYSTADLFFSAMKDQSPRVMRIVPLLYQGEVFSGAFQGIPSRIAEMDSKIAALQTYFAQNPKALDPKLAKDPNAERAKLEWDYYWSLKRLVTGAHAHGLSLGYVPTANGGCSLPSMSDVRFALEDMIASANPITPPQHVGDWEAPRATIDASSVAVDSGPNSPYVKNYGADAYQGPARDPHVGWVYAGEPLSPPGYSPAPAISPPMLPEDVPNSLSTDPPTSH